MLEGCAGGDLKSHSAPHSAGYLGYSSGFSLSCMVFFLIAVSDLLPWRGQGPGLVGASSVRGEGPDL